ncbi:Outer membrane efflux protein BepC precursor [Sedimentisphaera cyanobacteriorum]|uniref:Outer membrane efflux protein BepC n=1 Tax=Sedimentisphaera cyanobacteriorum TaxID=1940790 RepID=A0A1Q2HRX3_9BACT|nr:TolC family protein [Sedimentisphaera cyanobacteriorum]AQQ09985.1 Outer membrane efflux protein BepC precursor [Sedimentisphaera cyanobacteriorum]
MKIKISAIVILTASLFAGEADFELPAGSLTIEKACKIALENNPQIDAALERIKAAEAIVKQAKASNYPSVKGGAGYQALNSAEEPGWAPYTHQREAFNEKSLSLEASFLLFDGFGRKASILESKSYSKSQSQKLYDTKRLLLEAVSSAFFRAQLAVENMVIARQNRNFNKLLEEDAEKKLAAQTIAASEAMNFSVKALKAETDFLQAKKNFRVIAAALAELLAVPGSELPEKMYPIRSGKEVKSKKLNTEKLIAESLRSRPDLEAIDYQIEAGRQNIKKQKSEFAPEIALVAGVDYSKTNAGDYDQDEYTSYIGVNAVWQLYTGGARTGRVNQARSELSRLKQQKTLKVLSIQSSVRQAAETAEINYQTCLRNKKIYELTKKIRDDVEKSYKAGAVSLTRLNEAQTDMVNAAGALEASKIQYRISLVELSSQTGEILKQFE